MTNSVKQLAESLRDSLAGERPIPLPVRALIAATLMCSRGAAPTRLGMSKVGNYSYGSSQNHYADLLDALVEQLPKAIAEMASGDIDPVYAARLREDLMQRDATISSLRVELADLTRRHEEVRRYALAQHQRLLQIDAQAAAETGLAMRNLHPIL